MEKLLVKSKLFDYSVEFISDFSIKLNDFNERSIFIIDQIVFNLYKSQLTKLDKNKIFLVHADESQKTMKTVLKVIDFMKKNGLQKDWKIACIGGGITQDVATVASSLYLRNIEWYFFPTTLLAMADSCIGGKAGINFEKYKNQIGVFYPPKAIYIDTNFLITQSKKDIINGWGEILKFSLTLDENFFKKILQIKDFFDINILPEFIFDSLVTKRTVIETDEFELDFRRVLNYGHTFGHALEAYSSNFIPHGEAVIWGIDVVNFIAYKIKLIEYDYYFEIKQLIKKFLIQNEIVIKDPKKLFEIIKTDKKVKNGFLYFALLNGKSNLIVHPLKIDENLLNYFYEYLETTHEFYSY